MELHIVSVSRKAQDPLTASAELYLKRLQQFGPANLQRYKRTIELEKQLLGAEPIVLLCPKGAIICSATIAQRLADWQRLGKKRALFAIGAADGHAPQQRCQERWSFGAITLPHRLALVVLLEQLYRAKTMLAGHKYHRAD